jgi:protocatechuate 3,4-dioxygenase beta subunit
MEKMKRLLVPFLALPLLCAGCSGPTSGRSAPSPSPVASASGPSASEAQATAQQPASACPDSATPAETEGPYFKAGSPERASLLDPQTLGTRLTLRGRVFGPGCKPLGGVILDFWQASAAGVYDNSGYGLRGHQSTDAEGRYVLTTVVPGEYPGRTQHIHVKVEAPGRPVLTTQLYFPGAAKNAGDSIFRPALLMKVTGTASRMEAAYDFVLPG